MLKLEPLRKCRICGLEAYTDEDLDAFTKDKRRPHGCDNLCKPCRNTQYSKGGKYWSVTKLRLDRWHKLNKLQDPDYDLKRLNFPGKHYRFKENPRTNICSECNRSYPNELKHQTCLHHDDYVESNPLKGTRELCRSCHMKYHYSKRRIDNQGRFLHNAVKLLEIAKEEMSAKEVIYNGV